MLNVNVVLALVCIGGYGHAALGQDYIGCFKSAASAPDLDFSTLILSRASSPAECVKECRSRYYMFSGLMNGQQCYCGSKFGRSGLSTRCNIPCATDPANYCGGQDAISIYSTGQKGPSPPRQVRVVRSSLESLTVTWEPPDIPNGNITLYSLKATVLETYSRNELPPVETQVEGGPSNSTILQGLHAGTKYNVTITATNVHPGGTSEPASVTEWTLIGPPRKPAIPSITNRTESTLTVLLSEGASENGPVTAYQVFVVQPGVIPPAGPNLRYPSYEASTQQALGYYVTGEFESSEFHNYKRFTVGNGKMIGGYYNAPLHNAAAAAAAALELPRIGLAVVSRFQRQVEYAYSDTATTSIENDARILGRRQQPGPGDGARASTDYTAVALWVAITLLGALLLASILVYVLLRQRHERLFRMKKLPERQELTLQGPVYEVDNMAYIPEDVPERTNHYQALKNKDTLTVCPITRVTEPYLPEFELHQ